MWLMATLLCPCPVRSLRHDKTEVPDETTEAALLRASVASLQAENRQFQATAAAVTAAQPAAEKERDRLGSHNSVLKQMIAKLHDQVKTMARELKVRLGVALALYRCLSRGLCYVTNRM